MYVVTIPNRSSRPAILLRESYRDGDRVKNRTLANLSSWAPERIDALRAALRGDKPTIARNVVSFGKVGEMTVFTRPTEIQQHALDLLGVKI
jgi:hypothetical protein